MASHIRTDLRRSVVMLTAVLALLLAAGCGADSATTLSQPEPQEGQPVASTTPSADDAGEDVVDESSESAREAGFGDRATSLTGIVGGDTALEGGCLWVEVGGERYQLAPTPESGLQIDTTNLQIRRTDGTVVAAAGDEVIMTGTIDAEAMTFCQVGPVFMAIDVGATS